MEKSHEEPASTPPPSGQWGDWLGEDGGCQATRPGKGAEVCTGGTRRARGTLWSAPFLYFLNVPQ